MIAAAAAEAPAITEIRPQVGPQEAFLSSSADIVIGGGAAGGGKSFALLMEPIRHLNNQNAGAVIFRRKYPLITNEGGLWDEADKIYPHLNGIGNSQGLTYSFPSGFKIKFAHMQHAKDRYTWKGAQIPILLFDQLEEFEEDQFWYLTSRNRSARAGFDPYLRATCNPVPDDDPTGGWLNRLVSWWWDLDTGYAIPERSGVIRWFVRIENKLEWADSAEELRGKYPNVKASSITFIPSRLEDNPALTKQDPTYESKLEALPLVERERLRWGNWKIKPQAGKVFNRANFKIVDALPTDVPLWVRYWDKAGTEGGGKFTAGVLMGLRKNGRLIIADVERGQWSSGQRENVIRQKAQYDATHLVKYEAWVEQEPGSGGKESAENTIRKTLAGFDAHAERVTGDKLTRARPLSAQAEAENVDLLRGAWNEDFLSEAHSFDGVTGFTDQIDAASGAANKLLLAPRKIKGAVWGR